MSDFTPEQKSIIDFDNGNILVSASAGSGKTTVMIERLVNLITSGKATVSEILALTFTEAAAEEMKARLKKEIGKRIGNGDKKLNEQLNDIRSSDISTIDSYCSKLIRSYFFEAGVTPDFQIADENKTSELKEEAIKNVFKKRYANDEEFSKYVDRFTSSRSDNDLKEYLFDIYRFLSTEGDIDAVIERYKGVTFETIKNVNFTNFKNSVNELFYKLKEINAFLEPYDMPKAKSFMADLFLAIDNMLNSENLYLALESANFPRMSFEKTDDEALKEVSEEIKEIKGEITKLVKNYKSFCIDEKTDEERFLNAVKSEYYLIELSNEFAKEFTKLKREENLLDFADIERLVLKIFKNEEILNQVREKYKYVFVDEYQDINGVQEEIITKISKGNLFMVGDEKQSIYGFRGCRPEFFANKFLSMQKSGEKTERLNNNYRSSDAVIDMVNRVFGFSMTKAKYGFDYKLKSNLISGGKYKDFKGEANLHILYKDKTESETEKPRIYDIKNEALAERETDDNLTVSLIAHIIDEELEKEYYDVKNKRLKKIEMKDIAIIARNKDNEYIQGIIKGLSRRGIEVCSGSEEDICLFPEIQNAINFLRLVDSFDSDLPLVSVLKSEIVGLTENELAEIADFYNENAFNNGIKLRKEFSVYFNYYLNNAKGELCDKLKRFHEYIEKIRFVSDFLTAGEILEKVVNEFCISTYLYVKPLGEAKVRRLNRLISYCNENELSVKALLKTVDGGNKKITIEAGGNDNCVKLMTIHASKGLEFPVVIVCGLERKFNIEDMKGNVLFDRNLGFAIKTFDDETRTSKENLFRKAVKTNLYDNLIKEELRLFYVALTRASYSVHLTAVLDTDNRKKEFFKAYRYIDFIPASIKAKEYRKEDLNGLSTLRSPEKVIITQQTETGIAEMKKRFSFEYPFKEDTLLPLKSSVTEANKIVNENEPSFKMFENETSKNNAEQGLIAHRIMQHFDFGCDFDEQIDCMIKSNILTTEDISKINLGKIKHAISSSMFKSVVGKTTKREQAFITKVKASDVFNGVSDTPILLQGVIDLMVIDGDEVDIFDYKYSLKSATELKKEYEKQLTLYGYAVENVLKKRVRRKIIVSLLTGECVEID